MYVFVPRYASPARPYGLVPPSPPAERRISRRALLEKELRFPLSNRVLCPGMKGYEETVQAIGTGIFAPGLAGYRREATKTSGGSVHADWNGITFYLKFNSDTQDATPNAYNFTASGSPGYTTGLIGAAANGAIRLQSASTQFVGRDNFEGFALGPGVQFALGFWVNFQSNSPSNQKLAGGGTASPFRMDMDWSLGVVRYIIRDGVPNQDTINTFGSISLSTWYFMMFGFDGTQIWSSKDGAAKSLATPPTATYAVSDTSKRYEIGAFNSATQLANYDMDGDFYILGQTPSDARIASIYNAGAGKDYPN